MRNINTHTSYFECDWSSSKAFQREIKLMGLLQQTITWYIKMPCWRASSFLFPHWDVKTESLTSQAWLAFVLMSQCRNTNELALQHGGFCTTWSSFVAKSVLGSFHCKLNPSECQQKSPYYLWQSVESFWRSLKIGKNLPWFLRLLKITRSLLKTFQIF